MCGMRRHHSAHGRFIGAVALVLAAAVSAGCAASAPASEAPSPEPPSEIVVGAVGAFTSFNPGSVAGATAVNETVADFTHETFAYLDDELSVVGNGGFGEVERISADPLTVQYTLFAGRKWSDGTPVTVDDLLFGWAVHSGWFDDAVYDQTGEVVAGTRYFDTAASTHGLRQTGRPEIDRSDRSITITYDEPFADWNREWLLDRPAHAVAEQAGVSLAELRDALETAPRGDPLAVVDPDPVLLASAAAWNNGFDLAAEPDAAVAAANGPYAAESWNAEEVALARNPAYEGNHDPHIDRVIVRGFPDEQTLRDAVASGEVDVAHLAEPTASQLGYLVDAGVIVHPGARPRTLALRFTDEGEDLDQAVREALVMSIDRETLVDESVAAIDPEAVPAQSFLSSSAFGDGHDALVAASDPPATGSDPDAARALLDGRAPVLRIRYEPTDVLSADVFAQIARMAQRAGISVRPAGDTDAAEAELVTLDVGGSLLQSATERVVDGAGGLAARDALIALRERSDPEEVVAAAAEVDRALFAHGYGLPLVERGGAVVVAADLAGVGATAGERLPRYFWTWMLTPNA